MSSKARPSRSRVDVIHITNGAFLNDVKWVIKVRSKDETRYVLSRVLVESVSPDSGAQYIVCTDGRRAHRIKVATDMPTPMIPNGCYDILSETNGLFIALPPKGEEGTYPAYRQVMPDFVSSSGEVKNFKKIGEAYDVDQALYILNRAASCMSIEFVQDAMKGRGRTDVYISTRDVATLAPVMLCGDGWQTVIMPKRITHGSGKAEGDCNVTD